MASALGKLADRFVMAFVPKTTAGACPCNDCYTTSSGCPSGKIRSCCTNCNCTKTTCGACY